MYLVMTHYKKPLPIVDESLHLHRSFLDIGYQKGYFIVSGPRNPRTGGIILSQLQNRDELEKILKEDPFYISGIADFEIHEFNPVKYHENFSVFLK